MLTLSRRHLHTCKHRSKGRRHRSCQCPLWVQGALRGESIRRGLDLRSWEAGQDLIREWEGRGPKAVLMTVDDSIEKFLEDGRARKLADSTLGKLGVLLRRLKTFAKHASIKYVSQIRPDQIRDFRATWPDSGISAAKNLER